MESVADAVQKSPPAPLEPQALTGDFG